MNETSSLYDGSAAASTANAGVFLVFSIILLALMVVVVVGVWKMFQKAGQPGWASIVPIYNIIVLMRIAGRPAWWVLLFLVPFVSLIVSVIIALDIAKAFGKSTVFGVVGLFLFSSIGYMILGFGDAKYQLNSANPAPATPPTPPTPAAPAANA